jgi:hypothetical protein
MISGSLDKGATLTKTSGSGARAALSLRQTEDSFGDPDFQVSVTL